MEDDLAQYYFAKLNSSTGDHPKEKGFLLPDARCHGVYIDITGEELETQLQSCRNEIISRDDLNVNLVVRLGSAMVCQTVSQAFIDMHWHLTHFGPTLRESNNLPIVVKSLLMIFLR